MASNKMINDTWHLSVSLCFCLLLSVYVCLYPLMSVYVPFSPFLSVYVCLYLFLSVSVHFCHFPPPRFYLFLSFYIYLCICLSISLSFRPLLSVSVCSVCFCPLLSVWGLFRYRCYYQPTLRVSVPPICRICMSWFCVLCLHRSRTANMYCMAPCTQLPVSWPSWLIVSSPPDD